MSKSVVMAIIFIVHIIGGIVTMFVHHKNGEFKEAAKNGDGIWFATPVDVVFLDLVAWEIQLLLFIIIMIDLGVNKLFDKKYNS